MGPGKKIPSETVDLPLAVTLIYIFLRYESCNYGIDELIIISFQYQYTVGMCKWFFLNYTINLIYLSLGKNYHTVLENDASNHLKTVVVQRAPSVCVSICAYLRRNSSRVTVAAAEKNIITDATSIH